MARPSIEVRPLAKRWLVSAMLLAMACASPRDHDAPIVPEGLQVSALPGGNGVLELSALTLRRGASNLEVYAELANVGDVEACSAALSIELFDARGQSLAAGIGGVLTQQLYRWRDGSNAIAACIGPGEVAMAGVTELPEDLTLEDVAQIVYRCPYFALDVIRIEGPSVRGLQRVSGAAGTSYTGTLVNQLDVAVRNPSVTVFPISRAGRPLGSAIGSSAIVLAPGAQWAFETSSVDEAGVDQLAYPAGAIGDVR